MNRPKATDLFEQLSPGFRLDPTFGPVFDTPPAGSDDLTEIRGIDTREAVILNRLGVYQWAQLALWTDPEATHFAKELGMGFSTLAEEAWVEQARSLCHPTDVPTAVPHRSLALPASLIRTLSLLSCAMLIGCLVVYWLSLQSELPLRGVLSADITSVRVPADARVMETFVQAGDEVFTGDKLLTLEKTAHLSVVSQQQQRVAELERKLNRAEAQAVLDLEWRLREIEREMSDVRTQTHRIQEVKRNPKRSLRSASTTTMPAAPPQIVSEAVLADAKPSATPKSSPTSKSTSSTTATTVSRSRFYTKPDRSRTNNLIFYGATGHSNINVPRPAVKRVAAIKPEPLPEPTPEPALLPEPPPAPLLVAAPPVPQMTLTSSPAAESLLSAEAVSMRLRLERLEELKESLPEQVRRAAGVDSSQTLLKEAVKCLTEIQTISREVAVLCPGYGRVGEVPFRPGDQMAAGETMLKILHTDRRYVLLHVPTRRMNEIQPGSSVELIFPGNQRFQGQVTNLPMLAEASTNGQSQATVRVEPTGRLWPEIPIGSQIDVLLK